MRVKGLQAACNELKEAATKFDTHVLQSIPAYVTQFETVFGAGDIDMDKVTSAIAAFEETLVTPNSRVDLWLKADDNALTGDELAG